MALRQRPVAAATNEGSPVTRQAQKSSAKEQNQIRRDGKAEPKNGLAMLLLVLTFIGAIASVAYQAMLRTPAPLPESAPAQVFSEERAMRHVEVLANEIGIRTVGSDNHIRAAAYLLKQLKKISETAGDHLRVEVDEQRASGSFWINFLTHNLALEYENITNIVLRISGKEDSPDGKAVLMNAHYDSQVGSPGASDCAQCVGVALEIARLFASSPTPPHAPLIFLFNGAEETYLMGAHGFHSSHPWNETVGAVINIESTGSGGPDMVFQAAGKDLWPVKVYADVAPYPRASVIGQDFFDAHVIPGDTDFRIFAQDFGHVPGVDVVSLLDSYAYHTTQDTPDRIRRGTVQAMGENLYALMGALSAAPQLNDATANLPKQRAVYWDFLGIFQVYYRRSTALALHLAPLAIVALVPFLSSERSSGLPGVASRYRAIAAGILQSAAAWLLALAFAVGVAVLRVAVSGRPVSWLSRPLVGAAMYAPPALLGVFLVQSLRSPGPSPDNPNKQRARDFTGHWGAGVGFNALLSVILVLLGVGASFLSALWAAALVPGLFVATRAGGFRTVSGVAAYLALATAPLAQAFYVASTLGTFVAQKVQTSGNWPDPIGTYLGDLLLSAIIALEVVLIAGPLAPALRDYVSRKQVMRFLVNITILSSLIGSARFPYSPTVLKRLAVQHTLWTNGTDDVISHDFAMLTFDPLAPTFFFDHSPAFPEHFGDKAVLTRTRPNTWLGLYPLSEMVHRDVSVPDPSPQLPTAAQRKPLPKLEVISSEEFGQGRRRVHIEVANGASGPAWRTINVTGPVVGWSLGGGSLPPPERRPGGPDAYHCKHAGGPGMDTWRFWIEAEGTDRVRIDLAVLDLETTPELQAVRNTLPDWADWVGLTSYISTWHV